MIVFLVINSRIFKGILCRNINLMSRFLVLIFVIIIFIPLVALSPGILFNYGREFRCLIAIRENVSFVCLSILPHLAASLCLNVSPANCRMKLFFFAVLELIVQSRHYFCSLILEFVFIEFLGIPSLVKSYIVYFECLAHVLFFDSVKKPFHEPIPFQPVKLISNKTAT